MLSLLEKLALGRAVRRRALRRAAQLLAFFTALLAVSSAWAAAPMCDVQGQTIAAPPPLAPAETGEIRSVAICNPLDKLTLGAPLPDRSSSGAFADAPPRVLPIAWLLPVLPVSARQRLDASTSVAARPGYAPSVFHPPCCR
jgi:hypothetical protein